MQMTNTIAGVFRPADKVRGVAYDLLIIICGSLLVGISAQIKVYLPFSPVPVTGQTFVVLMLGAMLGSYRGGLTMLTYLVEGVLGLPVFTGVTGVAALFGPTGGYLVGFVVAAYIVGRLAELGWDRHVSTTVAAMLIGDAVLLAFGFVWLTLLLADVRTAFIAGVVPFIAGDILKIALAAAVLPAAWQLLKQIQTLKIKM
jgi:biotin transport system substrate-specific component